MKPDHTLRFEWFVIASKQMLADAELLNLVVERDLGRLPPKLHMLAVKKLDELVSECCRAVQDGKSPESVREQIAKDTWNFLKPWKRDDVPRGSSNASDQTSSSTT